MLSHVYLIALCAVGLAIVAAVVEAVVSVSRTRGWQVDRSLLTLVETEDRRHVALPFVGADRRDAAAGVADEVEVRQAA